MTTSINLEQQLALRLDREAKKYWDEIITDMQDMAKEFNLEKVDEKSPFRNVLNVAIEPNTSFEVLKNFIRYQVGRQGSNKIWKEKKNDQLFADAVVGKIDGLKKFTEEILGAIAQKINERLEELEDDSREKESLLDLKAYLDKNRQTLIQSQHLKLTQLYLGYLSREHTAMSAEAKAKSENKNKQ